MFGVSTVLKQAVKAVGEEEELFPKHATQTGFRHYSIEVSPRLSQRAAGGEKTCCPPTAPEAAFIPFLVFFFSFVNHIDYYKKVNFLKLPLCCFTECSKQIAQ